MSLKLSDLIWGLALIILGIGVGGDVLRIWDFSVFFSGFWAFFIIIPCGVNIFENGIRLGNLIGLGIGVSFLLCQWIPTMEMLLVPMILVVIGMALLIVPSRREDLYDQVNEYIHTLVEKEKAK